MAISDKHPCYTERLPDWQLLSDCYAGERAVKDKGDAYLPPTSGMIANGYGKADLTQTSTIGRVAYTTDQIGQAAYDAYRLRAVFHPFVAEAIAGLVGVIHRKPPKVEVPKRLEAMLESMTADGETLEQLWRRVTEAQLLHGRCGLLTDVPSGESVATLTPYVAIYAAPTITNWDDSAREQGRRVVQLVVLEESENVRQGDLSWQWVQKWRVLALAPVAQSLSVDDGTIPEAGYVVGEYQSAGSDGPKLTAPGWIAPEGAATLERIPFVFVNANDLVARPDMPPLLGLANLCMTIYRGEADYRQSLFMQGQDTLCRTGATDEQQAVMTGVGAIVDLPPGGTLQYVGVSGQGLPEQRTAIESDKEQAALYSVQMLDTKGGDAESGEALRIRISARTATLARLQRTAAAGIRDALIYAGMFVGLSPSELAQIVVEPNLEFSDDKAPPTEVSTLTDAIVKGAPISRASFHAWLVANGYTTMTYEEEIERIKEEMGEFGSGGTDVELDPGDEADPDEDDDEAAAA